MILEKAPVMAESARRVRRYVGDKRFFHIDFNKSIEITAGASHYNAAETELRRARMDQYLLPAPRIELVHPKDPAYGQEPDGGAKPSDRGMRTLRL